MEELAIQDNRGVSETQILSAEEQPYEVVAGDFLLKLSEASGVKLQNCYQCQKCSAGCVLAPYMDLLPHQVVKMAQLGQEKELLTSKGIWLCATCYTCTVRCPNEIDVSRIMDALRRLVSEKELTAETSRALNFHKIFLRSVRIVGRIYELGMLGQYKLKQREMFSDLKLAWELYRKGKIKFLPPFIKGRRHVRKIFAGK